MDDLELHSLNESLLKPFDESVIEDKQGKRYIGHEYIRDRIIYATRNQFDWDVSSIEYRDDGAVRARKSGNIPPVMIVSGTLTIPGLGRRNGTGVQVIEEGAGEDTYKAAESDAFKRAAMAFGVGLKQLYMNAPAVQQATARATPARPPTRQQTAKPQDNGDKPEEREILTDAQFDEKVRQALKTKNGTAYRALVDQAENYDGRWVILVRNCESDAALDWIESSAKRKGVESALLTHEIESRRNWLLAERAKAPF